MTGPGQGRSPGAVPDEAGFDEGGGDEVAGQQADVSSGFDTDGDGRPDTLLADDGFDLIVLTDLSGDGQADRVLRIGPDGVAREAGYPAAEQVADLAVDGLWSGAATGRDRLDSGP